jgi:hypothetical protein
MNAAERPRASLPVLGIIQLRTLRKKPLVRNAVVPRQHLKMSQEVHSYEVNILKSAQGLSIRMDVRLPDQQRRAEARNGHLGTSGYVALSLAIQSWVGASCGNEISG